MPVRRGYPTAKLTVPVETRERFDECRNRSRRRLGRKELCIDEFLELLLDIYELHEERSVSTIDTPDRLRSDGGGPDRTERSKLARQAFTAAGTTGIDGDPYWLCNLHGHANTDDLQQLAHKLREDADVIEVAAGRLDAGEFVPAEAALYIARNVAFGDYKIHDDIDVPITEVPRP